METRMIIITRWMRSSSPRGLKCNGVLGPVHPLGEKVSKINHSRFIIMYVNI